MKDQFLIIAMPFRRHALEFESWNLFGIWVMEFGICAALKLTFVKKPGSA